MALSLKPADLAAWLTNSLIRGRLSNRPGKDTVSILVMHTNKI